jgi:splicing factor 3B subunit 3
MPFQLELIDIGKTFVIGTHRPSVEILSFIPKKGLRVLASGMISLTNTMGTAISGYIPQDVRLVSVDRLYILSGLRNGMLLRFEWPDASKVSSSEFPKYQSLSSSLENTPTALSGVRVPTSCSPRLCEANLFQKTDDVPVNLQLIAIRHIGITPVFLVPLSDSLDADLIALSDRPWLLHTTRHNLPWLLHTTRHNLSYTSISFQPSTHVTPVCSVECPKGVLFVEENSLHLVRTPFYGVIYFVGIWLSILRLFFFSLRKIMLSFIPSI